MANSEVTGFTYKNPSKMAYEGMTDKGLLSAFSPDNSYGMQTNLAVPTIQTAMTPNSANALTAPAPQSVISGASQVTPQGTDMGSYFMSKDTMDYSKPLVQGQDTRDFMNNNAETAIDPMDIKPGETGLEYSQRMEGVAKRAEADNLNATPWADYASAAAAGLGAITGAATYFDNKKMNRASMRALDTNIEIAREEQQHRRDFRGNAKSAFAQ